jgi:hypothetical protein
MKILHVLLFTVLGSCAATTDASVAEASVVHLFDGQSLAGWRVEVGPDTPSSEGIFRVQDGLLVCSGQPTAVLRTAGEFEDYELTLEWRWAPGSAGGNSGLLLHCSTPRARGLWPRCIEAQLKSGAAGDFHLMGDGVTLEPSGDASRRSGSRVPRVSGSERPVGEWNAIRVVCEGDRLSVYLNGELANGGSGASERRGAIGLQSEGAEIHFRRVDLRMLGR